MFSINTNNNALAALQSLDKTEQALSTTQNEVSTGQKVSSAQDNPAVYAISQTMNADIAGLSAVSDSLNLGSAVLSTASAAASNISGYLATLQQTVTDAQQTGMDPTTMQNQIDAAVQQINQFANTATFNGANILASTTTPPTGVINTSLNIVQDMNGDGISVGNQLGGANSLAEALGLTSATGQNLQVKASGLEVSISSSATIAQGDTLTLVNADGSEDVFEFAVSGSAPTTAPVANSNGTPDPTGTPPVLSNAVNVHTVLVDPSTQSLSTMLSTLVSSVDAAGYTAVINSSGNLDVTGDLMTAGTGATATPGIGGNGDTAGLSTTGTTTAVIDGGTAAVAVVQNAVSKMAAIQATLGSFSIQVTGMENFTSALSSALTQGVGALTDADLAQESAQLTSLQTKQQLAIQSLSIANSQPQALLSLFR